MLGFLFKKRPKPIGAISTVNKNDFCGQKPNCVPEGWFVYELAQSPDFCLWYCTLGKLVQTDKDKQRIVQSDECDTMEEALLKASRQII
jgi:hypothetical protein